MKTVAVSHRAAAWVNAPFAAAAGICTLLAIGPMARAQDPYQSSTDFAHYAERLRDNAVLQVQPQVVIHGDQYSAPGYDNSGGGRAGPPFNPAVPYQWKTDIVTTIFWVGEPAAVHNPVNNVSSSWDLNWAQNFGGLDDPDPSRRRNFVAVGFTPRLNPFYCALPYNDVTKGSTKPESRLVIPWYEHAFEEEGRSVCKDRWVAIRSQRSNRVCFAQWSDCGPFRTDHWQYVFGSERPRPNLNQGAGLDISPAVRDYLGFTGTDVTDWKFVEFREIPRGPWSMYGMNNTFVQQARGEMDRTVRATATAPTYSAPPPVATLTGSGGPQVSVH